MEKQQRVIKLYPDKVSVCTIGPVGDGSDNTIKEYENCYVHTGYHLTLIVTLDKDAT